MSSATINPIEHPEFWDFAVIAGIQTPGLAGVSGFNRPWKWDVKDARGSAGATETFQGGPPSKGKLTLRFWTAEQIDEWYTLQASLMYEPGKRDAAPVRFLHPATFSLGIDKVVIEVIGQIERKGGGLYEVVLDLLEFRPPPKKDVSSTPKKGSAGTASGKPGEPADNESPADKVRHEQLKAAAGRFGDALAS
jgi:hypothetical protein